MARMQRRKVQVSRRRAQVVSRNRRARGGIEIRSSLVRTFGRPFRLMWRDIGRLVASWR